MKHRMLVTLAVALCIGRYSATPSLAASGALARTGLPDVAANDNTKPGGRL